MSKVTVVTAVPGSGKTRHIVTEAAAAVVAGTYQEADIICLTFSRDAAMELKRRLVKFPAITASTIHSLAGTLTPSCDVSRSYDTVIQYATEHMPAHHFKVVFIDEAQDLTSLQKDFLAALCRTVDRVVIVGDPMQSIYQFNGSSPQYMYELAETLDSAYANITLTESYRCGSTICHTLNVGFKTGIHAAQQHMSDVLWYEFTSPTERCERLLTTMHQDTGLILVRTNAEISRLMKQLPENSVNAHFTINDHPYVILMNLHRGTVPISRRDLQTLLFVYGLNDYNTRRALSLFPKSVTGIELREMLTPTILSNTSSSLHTFLWTIKMTLDTLPDDPCGMIMVLAQQLQLIGWDHVPLVALCAAYADDGGTTFRISLDNGAPYTIMTMHAAKGLEGHTVILFPDELGDIAEEEHLLYVAMSRASHQLLVFHGADPSRCDTMLKNIIPMV